MLRLIDRSGKTRRVVGVALSGGVLVLRHGEHAGGDLLAAPAGQVFHEFQTRRNWLGGIGLVLLAALIGVVAVPLWLMRDSPAFPAWVLPVVGLAALGLLLGGLWCFRPRRHLRLLCPAAGVALESAWADCIDEAAPKAGQAAWEGVLARLGPAAPQIADLPVVLLSLAAHVRPNLWAYLGWMPLVVIPYKVTREPLLLLALLIPIGVGVAKLLPWLRLPRPYRRAAALAQKGDLDGARTLLLAWLDGASAAPPQALHLAIELLLRQDRPDLVARLAPLMPEPEQRTWGEQLAAAVEALAAQAADGRVFTTAKAASAATYSSLSQP